jgi:hypothetical protein
MNDAADGGAQKSPSTTFDTDVSRLVQEYYFWDIDIDVSEKLRLITFHPRQCIREL